MKDIPVEEVAAISPEIHDEAVRIGCTHVAVTGHIWPGGRLSGKIEEAARFLEYSWFKAAVVHGRAIFEEPDPKAYAELLNAYGLGDEPYPEPAPSADESIQPSLAPEPTAPEVAELKLTVRPETKRELERQAAAEGIRVSQLLDWKFRPRDGR